MFAQNVFYIQIIQYNLHYSTECSCCKMCFSILRTQLRQTNATELFSWNPSSHCVEPQVSMEHSLENTTEHCCHAASMVEQHKMCSPAC
jgi:hypothetical protein